MDWYPTGSKGIKNSMGLNLFEKIILSHSRQDNIRVNDTVEVDIDGMMIHDFFAPFCIDKFHEMGFEKVVKPDRVVFVYDHLIPTAFVDDNRHHRVIEAFTASHDITHIHRSDGVCHQLMHEQGYVRPGEIILGADSHTVTYGAIGALATGIGYTEMAAVLGTGKLWLKVAPVIKLNVRGTLPKGVFSKDVILGILGRIRNDGANYRVLEFAGPVIEDMSIDSRLTLSNMSVEAGAKAGIIAADGKTVQYLKRHFPSDELNLVASDIDAEYEAVIEFDVSQMSPLVACPFNVDNVGSVTDHSDVTIDQAFLGSCTNGRLEDLAIASRVLEGRRVHPNVRFYVVPASREIFLQAVRKGYIGTLVAAGAVVGHPACSLCAGISGGILEDGERIISANNRNFYGRMGGSQVEIYLGSPATVAASAIEGRISDCRKYL
ncbi:MAG: aconitase/3-isopropylmalate dehydratase large subunit family protein [Thermodesulfobacteriota bacterium]